MGMEGVFGGTMPLLEQALDLRSKKHSLIVSNITNADTPNYKAFDLLVEDELRKQGSGEKDVVLRTTHPGHLESSPHERNPGIRRVEADSLTVKRSDNNTVDIDREMANLGENGLLYSASAQILANKFSSLAAAIKGGK
jgi:flagellar basal-body rod protein FlgB